MEENKKTEFDDQELKSFPYSERKVSVEIGQYCLSSTKHGNQRLKASTTYISPHGMEIQGTKDFPKGTLLKIDVHLPDYWNRKKNFVNYNRIDTPENFKVLAKVIKTEELSRRGKKKLILVKTVNIDEVDEKVLVSFLQEKKHGKS